MPDLSAWKLSPERGAAVRQQLQTLFVSLERMLVKKNELSRLKQELDAIEVEHKHFIEYYDERNTPAYPLFKKNVNSATALGLWLLCEQLAENSNKPNWFERLKNYFRRRKILKCFIHGMTNKIIKNLSPEIMITVFQKRYYEAKVQELTADISALYMSL
ncbi:hypothetical protein, partial [Treponema endosymbiont of Eucomonympha sp.]|uniref:hypothetical protein n=1 Tax=Treponema endosymbiont of Eucomonympha sp. TaxID=1580831 RepID=UPI0013968014